MARNRPADPVLKARALKLAEEYGPKRAAELSGVKESTLRAWRSRGASSTAATAVDSTRATRLPGAMPSEPAAAQIGGTVGELVKMGRAMLKTAEKARKAAEVKIAEGRTAGVRDLSIAAGVMIDQAGKLEAAASRLEVLQVEITQAQGERLGHILRLYFGALGVATLMERTQGVALLEACIQASRDGDVERLTSRSQERLRARVVAESSAELVDDARRVLREAFLTEVERERPAQERREGDEDWLALPAPEEINDVEVVEDGPDD